MQVSLETENVKEAEASAGHVKLTAGFERRCSLCQIRCVRGE